jgi:hypothetical protein
MVTGYSYDDGRIVSSVADPDPHLFWSAGSGSGLRIRIPTNVKKIHVLSYLYSCEN